MPNDTRPEAPERIWLSTTAVEHAVRDGFTITHRESAAPSDIEYVRASALRPAVSEGDGFQSIDTAPKDGTWILARTADGDWRRISWGTSRLGKPCWCSVTSAFFGPYGFVEWMPIPSAAPKPPQSAVHDEGHPHLIAGEFQSDKYPTCPRGKVPLSTKDKTAQDLLWEYAQRRRSVDAEFAADLEIALKAHGFEPQSPSLALAEDNRRLREVLKAVLQVGTRESISLPSKEILIILTDEARIAREALSTPSPHPHERKSTTGCMIEVLEKCHADLLERIEMDTRRGYIESRSANISKANLVLSLLKQQRDIRDAEIPHPHSQREEAFGGLLAAAKASKDFIGSLDGGEDADGNTLYISDLLDTVEAAIALAESCQ